MHWCLVNEDEKVYFSITLEFFFALEESDTICWWTENGVLQHYGRVTIFCDMGVVQHQSGVKECVDSFALLLKKCDTTQCDLRVK